jgi:hypothetical protein
MSLPGVLQILQLLILIYDTMFQSRVLKFFTASYIVTHIWLHHLHLQKPEITSSLSLIAIISFCY